MTLQQSLDNILYPYYQEQQYLYRSNLNVLFISPEATGGNYYRMIVPYWVLKKTGVVNTAITGWSKYNPAKRFRNEEKTPIRSKQILWADTIVFPFTNQPLKDFFEVCRTLNPNARLVYHVDFDFLEMPEKHPLKDAFTNKAVNDIIDNIVSADTTVVSNNLLATFLITKLQELGHEVDRSKFAVQILCYDDEVFLQNVDKPTDKDPEHFNLMVLAGDNQISDIKSVIDLLKEAKAKHGKTLKITFFGANKNKEGFSSMVKGLEYIPEKAVPIWNYYKKLAEINPDAVIIPSDQTEWTIRSHDYKRFIDCSILDFPTICPNCAPLNVIIKHGENGYLYNNRDEFHTVLDGLISDKALANTVGIAANDTAMQNFFYNKDKLQRLINLLG